MATPKKSGPRPFTVLLILMVVLGVAVFFAFNAVRKALVPAQTTQTAQTNTFTTTNNLFVDPECDKTDRLTDSLFTGSDVVSAAVVSPEICELVLSQGEHIRYTTEWSVGYYLTLWSEIAFTYGAFNPENPPEMTLTDLNIPWEGDLETTLSLHLARLSVLEEESVTPLMFESDVANMRETTLGKREALFLTHKSYPERQYYLFVEGPTQRVWALEVISADFFDAHEEEITNITDSLYYDSL